MLSLYLSTCTSLADICLLTAFGLSLHAALLHIWGTVFRWLMMAVVFIVVLPALVNPYFSGTFSWKVATEKQK